MKTMANILKETGVPMCKQCGKRPTREPVICPLSELGDPDDAPRMCDCCIECCNQCVNEV